MRRSRLLVALSLLALAGLAPQPASASATGTENIDLVLPTGLDVSGSIVDPDGNPIEDAFAELCEFEGGCYPFGGQTDATGAFRVLGVKPGTYTLGASKDGYIRVWLGPGDTSVTDFSQAATFEIAGDMSLPTLQLAAGFTMSGTLIGPDGFGVPDVEVFASGYEGSGGGVTDANGLFVLTGLAAGFYGVQVYPPVGSPFTAGSIAFGGTIQRELFDYWIEVDGDETGIDATLVAGRSISGTVTGLSGPAYVNVSGTPHGRALEIEADGSFNATGLWPDELQTLLVSVRSAGDDGQFPYGVYDGTSNLNADQNAYAEIDVSGGDVTGLTLAAPSLPSLTGTVLDDHGAAVSGYVNLCSNDLGCANMTLVGGAFAFVNLPDATFHMYVVAFQHVSGFATAAGGVTRAFDDALDIVIAGANSTLDVVVPDGLTMSGTITGPNGEPVVGGQIGVALASGEFFASATTDATGAYVVRGLIAADYFVGVSGPEGSDYFRGYWSEAGYTDDYAEADLVHVPSDGVTVLSTNPADGATGVVRTVQPSVTFSGSVDASGVVASLKGGRVPVAMRGTIAYDNATHTLTFKPRGRLLGMTTYVFEVSGLTASGVPVEPVSVTFTTRR